MANIIRVSNQSAPGISDPYGDAQRQQDYADLVTAQSLRPRGPFQGSNAQAIQMGLTQLAQALLGQKLQKDAGSAADSADATTRTANEKLLEALSPTMNRGAQLNAPTSLDSLAPTDAPVALGGTVEHAPDAVNPQHAMLADALMGQGTDPRAASGVLQTALLNRAMAGPVKPKILQVAPGGIALEEDPTSPTGYRQIASNPKEEVPKSLQHTESGLIFDPGSGTYKDASGQSFTSDQVAAREVTQAARRAAATSAATNAAKLAALPKGSMDYWVEWSLQNGGAAPPGSRSPQFLAEFGLAMKARALADGNPMAAQVANAKISKSLGPAISQTEKQIAANGSYLNTLERNIASADQLAQSVGGNNSPAMNKIFNMWKRGVTGDPQVKALDFWNNSIQGEAAKIASGGVGSVSATSDTQIEKQMHIMQTSDNYAAWRAAADAAIEEGHNRMNSLNGQIEVFRSQSQNSNGPPPVVPPIPTPRTGVTHSFATEDDAKAAAAAGTIQTGDRITVGGVSGTWH